MSEKQTDNVVDIKPKLEQKPLTRAQEAFRNIVQLAQMGLNGECAIVAAAIDQSLDNDD